MDQLSRNDVRASSPFDGGDPFADFEGPDHGDELSGETTHIDEERVLAEASTTILRDEPPRPRLRVEQGSDLAREFVLQAGENSIGRGIDNDVILSDIAVSRRHLLIIDDGEALHLQDLGSGNGTEVNGRRAQQADLKHRDRIEIGETVLVLEWPPPEPAPADVDAGASTPRSGERRTGASGAERLSAASGSVSTADGAASVRLTGSIVLPKRAFYGIMSAVAGLVAVIGGLVAVVVLQASPQDTSLLALPTAASTAPSAEAPAAGPGGPERPKAMPRPARGEAGERAVDEPAASGHPGRTLAEAIRSSAQRLGVRTAAARATASPRPAVALAGVRNRHTGEGPSRTRARKAPTRSQRTSRPRNVSAGHSSTKRQAVSGRRPPSAHSAPAPPAAPAHTEASSKGPTSGSAAKALGRSAVERLVRQTVRSYLDGAFRHASSTARAGAQGMNQRDGERMKRLAARIDHFARLYRVVQAANFSADALVEMEAAIRLDRQIARDPKYRRQLSSSVVQAYLVRARRLTSRPELACREVAKALAVNPGHPQALRMARSCRR